ncbi:MAG: hypothetical protein IPP53_14015 [Bacteroidetes bacterium]|nr:hypothetical protein [Bacteroidota bacterium]
MHRFLPNLFYPLTKAFLSQSGNLLSFGAKKHQIIWVLSTLKGLNRQRFQVQYKTSFNDFCPFAFQTIYLNPKKSNGINGYLQYRLPHAWRPNLLYNGA